jgi:site-specific recombinase XerD
MRIHPLAASGDWDMCMIWAAMTMAVFGLFRSGEIALDNREPHSSRRRLLASDLTFASSVAGRVMLVRLKISKVDTCAAGSTVTIGETRSSICPISAMETYLRIRRAHQGLIGGSESLFIFSDGATLRRYQLTTFLRAFLTRLGIDARLFAGHSFRIGGATALARAGAPAHIIQRMGRWSSDAYKTYIRTASSELAKFALLMACAK